MDEEQQLIEDKGGWLINEPLREMGCLPVVVGFIVIVIGITLVII
jgi:hypothetical protein